MEIINDVTGQNTPIILKYPVDDNGADLLAGSLVIKSTIAVDGGIITAAAATPIDIVGLLTQISDNGANSAAGYGEYNMDVEKSDWNEADVDVRPFGVYRSQLGEVAAGQDVDVASAVDGTTIDVSAITANYDFNGGWLYDDGTEQIRFITNSTSSNDRITCSAFTAIIGTGVTMTFAPPRLSGVASIYKQMKISASYSYMTIFDGLLATATGWERTLETRIQVHKGAALERLIPWKHNACNTEKAKLHVEFVINDHILKTIA